MIKKCENFSRGAQRRERKRRQFGWMVESRFLVAIPKIRVEVRVTGLEVLLFLEGLEVFETQAEF